MYARDIGTYAMLQGMFIDAETAAVLIGAATA